MVSLAENWKLAHTLGDKPLGTLVDGDVVSAVEFDEPSGQYLATGDRGGRVRIRGVAQATIKAAHAAAT